MTILKAAVIGVGEMGRHHARVYAEMDDVELVAVADTDEERAQNVTRNWGAKTYGDFRTMIDRTQPDMVSVTVPTSAHSLVAWLALSAGVHTLVEKPIASSMQEAHALIRRAKTFGCVLAVGHIERCNPIVTEVKRRLDAGDLGRVYRVSARRVGPSPERVRDVGVVMDLATHDLDVMRYLLRSEPVACQAELQWNDHDEHDDAADVLIKFDCGAVGVLSVDWLSAAKVRQLTVTGEKGVICVDYLTQRGWAQYAPGEREEIQVVQEEPLAVELRSFAAAVRGEGLPTATGEDGLRALEMALTVLEAGADGL